MDSKIIFGQKTTPERSQGSSLRPTPVNKNLPVKSSGFATLADALEYAANGDSGFNFYDHRGELDHVLSYRELRDEAKTLARRLLGLGLERGDRVGIIAETDPMFHRFFFACQYAGLIPGRIACRHSAWCAQGLCQSDSPDAGKLRRRHRGRARFSC